MLLMQLMQLMQQFPHSTIASINPNQNSPKTEKQNSYQIRIYCQGLFPRRWFLLTEANDA
jgi:hypothetical protein